MRRTIWLGAALGAGLLAMVAAPRPADAALTYLGNFAGQDCPNPPPPGFSNCWATQTGTVQSTNTNPPSDPTASLVVYKRDAGGGQEISTYFPTITGSEFTILYNGTTNEISFTYTPGAGDPNLHYVSVKQGNEYALFYDASPITGGMLDLDNYFPSNPGFSHITFYDTPGGGFPVPEPASLALLGAGLFGLGLARRRRRRA